MAIKYKASYSGIGQMLVSDFLQDEMHARILQAKELAENIAPVDESGPHPGRYKAAFVVEYGVRGGKEPRAYGRLTNVSPEALAVEFGTQNNPAHHVLVRSLDATGGTHGRATVARRDGKSKVRQARRVRNEKARARRAEKKRTATFGNAHDEDLDAQ